MAPIGKTELVVPATAIDANGHVNNVQYVQWMQAAAMAHSDELGWPQERYAAMGRTWIIRSHAIEYLHSAYAGETIAILTWVADLRKFRSLRKYKFIRPADQVVLATAETLFIFCDLHTGKPMTIPPEVREAYAIIAPANEP
ncbi:acyl-CoA thioesterase [Desulfobulbus elongatus]|uniref:acyl-CoA thioesterase n=1 Tax=Desulfobulbus elongatus TaxID=53332 RepID=UPI000484C00F|nr:thioesterase family protein [Desulfobulbus elongatus]